MIIERFCLIIESRSTCLSVLLHIDFERQTIYHETLFFIILLVGSHFIVFLQ